MKFKVKSDLMKLHNFLKKEFGHLPSPKELNLLIGGAPADWGRILKGQQKIKGEYHARLKCVKDVGLENAQFQLTAARRSKEYGGRTRKGRLVPHVNKLFVDMDNFELEQTVQNKLGGLYEYDYAHYNTYIDMMQEEEQYRYYYPRSFIEEQTLRREFIKTLS
jgi:hypothetical protein